MVATWPAVQSLVKALHDPGWQVSGRPVERLGRQAAISGGRLYVYYMCIGSKNRCHVLSGDVRVVSRSQTPFRLVLPGEMGSGERPLMSLCAA